MKERKAQIDSKAGSRLPKIQIRAKPHNELFMKFEENDSEVHTPFDKLRKSCDDRSSTEKFQTWDKIGDLVLTQLKKGNFDEYCRQNNKNYYMIRDKYAKLSPRKFSSSASRSSRASSRASRSNYGSRINFNLDTAESL